MEAKKRQIYEVLQSISTTRKQKVEGREIKVGEASWLQKKNEEWEEVLLKMWVLGATQGQLNHNILLWFIFKIPQLILKYNRDRKPLS